MLKYQSKILLIFFILLCFLSIGIKDVWANNEVLGMHILQPEELKHVRIIFEDDEWRYITIPLATSDTQNWQRWQIFFDEAYRLKLIPIIRLATTYDSEQQHWTIPTRKEIVNLITFLSSLNWHQKEKLVVVFNEVNHAQEWGGKIDPLAYTQVLKFTSNWLRSEGLNYKVLPAALDLATANVFPTMEAFSYLETMLRVDPEIFTYIDYWNSHSYPNPNFSASPKTNGQNPLKGFIYELNFLKNKTGRDFQTFITETGWKSSYIVNFYLSDYYTYALKNIWNDERVVAVTPFVLKGDPGPFAQFGFVDASDLPTVQASALKKALKKISP